jgi:hypothetical protein
LVVPQRVSPHRSAPIKLIAYESLFHLARNPLTDDTP